MLRWIAMSAVVCVGCATLGLGKIVPMAGGMSDMFLALAAFSGTVLVSSYDAYETQSADAED